MNIFDDFSLFEDEIFSEAVTMTSLPYMYISNKIVTLPQGTPVTKGNVAFLYSDNLDDSINMINSTENCLNQRKYKFYYFNILYQGKIYNKKYKYKLFEERKEIYKRIEDETTLQPKLKLPSNESNNKNMYYDLFKYLEIFTSICHKIQPLKYIEYYWEYMNRIFSINLSGYYNKFVIVNLKNFKLSKNIKENLLNPLYLLYFTLYRKPELVKNTNIDFLFYNGKKILKINPSQCDEKIYIKLRIQMNKIMEGIESEIVINEITDENNMKKSEIADNVASHIAEISDVVGSIVKNDEQLTTLKHISAVEKEVNEKIEKRVEAISDAVKDNNISVEIATKAVVNSVKKEIDEDHEMIRKLYYQNKKNDIEKSSASSARDELLRKEQKNLKINNMTFDQLSKIKSSEIEIPVSDVSNSLDTTNENVKSIRYDNLDITYNEKLMTKDITDAILSLNDKSIPLFIRDIKVEDTSDELNYKDTYTLYFEDGNRKRHTVKVDIPKFVDGRFLYIGGNKKLIKHQSFYLPVVKIAPNKVEIVTNYSKMTLERVENGGTSYVERMKKLISTNEMVASHFNNGTAYPNNIHHITTLEYDQYSKTYTSFRNGKTFIMFDQTVADTYREKNKINISEGKIFIGVKDKQSIYIDINKQTTDDNKTITDIILDSLTEDEKNAFLNIQSPKRLIYTKVKIMRQNVTVGMLLGLWGGLTNLLKKMNVDYRLVDKPEKLSADEESIKFSDCIMIYRQDIPISLVMNGFRMFDTSKYPISSFDEKEPYIDYITKVYGKAIIENALMNFYEFVIDPITKEILEYLHLPNEIIDLYIYAIRLLSDSQYTLSMNQNLSRIRCGEIIPAILYERLSKNYVNYRNSNGKQPFTVPQNCVIKELLAQKTVEDYSILNPTLEMEMIHAVSTKGFRGINLEESYTIEKRGYDDSMIGIMAPNTSPDGTVGIARTLTLEPQITNLRGIIDDKHEKLDELNDTNLFSPGELTIPLAASHDDPNRLGHSIKQSKHVIPVKNSSPVLISNGMEEVARFHLTSNFVINATESGEIIDYDEKSQVMIARYKSGKCQAIDLSPNIVKNGGGGFFLSNVLKTDLKVGDKFKKNDVLAYHKDFFKNDEFNNCRMNMGPLTKIAIMSTYNTYEDATFITHKLSEDCATEMCFCKSAVIGKNSNIFYMIKKGQEILVGEPLIQFDTSYEDETINSLLASLGEDDKKNILEGARNEIKSKYSGVIEDIKIYSTVDLDEMSPSLRKIVSSYYKEINKKKEFLEKYDPESKKSIIKCGILVNDTTHKIAPNQFGVIKGEKVEDGVLIEFYIKHSEPLEVGSKIANFTALKNTIGEIIPRGYEPYGHYRPDEEISTIIAANSILNRMTPSILMTALGNKCIIELKRHLKELNMDRKKMESMIYKFFSAFDKTGSNTKKYKNKFKDMTDNEFKKYFTAFFNNDDAYLILDIVDYERDIKMEDIEDAAKVLDVPLYEYVTLPHITMDKEKSITTKYPVPVGYINEKRTQQTVMKKNGVSTDISERSAILNQVSGGDKNGRESDLENTMLTILGMTNTLKELNAPRADDSVMKQQMLRDISLNGYTRLADMEDDINNKTTLNTVDCYFRGMSIETDLVVKGLMLPKTLKEEL